MNGKTSRSEARQGFTLIELPAVSERKAAGFTLIELLVVMAIIALLVSLLLPALKQARASAQSAQCLSQEHQMAVAMAAFAHDYKGYLPVNLVSGTHPWFPGVKQNGRWFLALNPYIGKSTDDSSRPSLFFCPVNDPHSVPDQFALWDDWGYLNSLQTMPRWQTVGPSLAWWPFAPKRMGEVAAHRALIADTNMLVRLAGRLQHVNFPNKTLADTNRPYGNNTSLAEVHLGGVNVLWADLHASHMAAAKINQPGNTISTGSYFWR